MTPRELIDQLGMQRHPEGGWYVETWRDADGPDGRSRATAIYYLLEAGDRSHWHRVDASEIWHWYAGAALTLTLSEDGVAVYSLALGPDIPAGERPQGVVPPHVWQSAQSTGAWTLVGCTVAPGFEFSGFEMAPADWSPAADARRSGRLIAGQQGAGDEG